MVSNDQSDKGCKVTHTKSGLQRKKGKDTIKKNKSLRRHNCQFKFEIRMFAPINMDFVVEESMGLINQTIHNPDKGIRQSFLPS